MDANIEAAGDAITGAVAAKALDKGPSAADPTASTHAPCKNCKTPITGKYCATCGQVAHPHRSLASLGHDILHGVFHVEGRIWNTLPELFFKPGRLTRRYIDGERAKFIAPLPLFLFSVFFMFAVFALTPDDALNYAKNGDIVETWKVGNRNAVATTDKLLEDRRASLNAPDLTVERRAEIEKQIADLESSKSVMEALSNADWAKVAKTAKQKRKGAAAAGTQSDSVSESESDGDSPGSFNLNFDGSEWAQNNRWVNALKQAQQNPGLLFYKVKTNVYKFSWALIPISIPFMWLLYFWRRDIHLYDHAVFITYSMSFMMLFLVVLAVSGTAGLSNDLRAAVFGIVAPVHMYKQMRHAYGSSRFGTMARLVVLSVFISIIVTVFFVSLLLVGVVS